MEIKASSIEIIIVFIHPSVCHLYAVFITYLQPYIARTANYGTTWQADLRRGARRSAKATLPKISTNYSTEYRFPDTISTLLRRQPLVWVESFNRATCDRKSDLTRLGLIFREL